MTSGIEKTQKPKRWTTLTCAVTLYIVIVGVCILHIVTNSFVFFMKADPTPKMIESTTRVHLLPTKQHEDKLHIELLTVYTSRERESTPSVMTCNSGNYICTVSTTKGNNPGKQADVAVFLGEKLPAYPPQKLPNQLWVLKTGESQRSISVNMTLWDGLFNYSFTFKQDSNVPNRWAPRTRKLKMRTKRNFSKEKGLDKSQKASALWLVSNCETVGLYRVTSARIEYGVELAEWINVTIFTHDSTCAKAANKLKPGVITTIRRRRKPPLENFHFYFSFENSLCEEYIGEKFWKILLAKSLQIPVVMGGLEMEEYERIAPPNSYIHVRNFTSPKHLAEHLKYVAEHEEAFNYYHQWRNEYQLEPEDSNVLCRLCTLAHERPHKVWNNISQHFNSNQCIDVSQSKDYCKYYNLTKSC